MKITFVLPFAGLSGGIKVVAIYARALSERGHDVTVVSQPYRRPSHLDRLKALVRKRTLAPPPFKSPYLDFPEAKHIILDSSRPITDRDVPDADVVIATWWETAEWVARLSPRKGRKFYLIQGYEVFPHLPIDRVIATYHLPMTKIAVSGYVRDMLRMNHEVETVHVVHNAVDIKHFTTTPRPKSESLTIGFLYQIAEVKNVALALDVAREAKNQFPDSKILAFGASSPSETRPVPSWIDYHLNPEQESIPLLYASCDVWLFTSTSEGFGLPILEAMACGTPVIATRAGAAPDLINGRNGVLVDSTTEAFMEQLRLFHDMGKEEWLTSSRAARETALENTWDVAVARFENLLQ